MIGDIIIPIIIAIMVVRFYNAMAGPTLILNTTQFGHADLLDELEAGANEVHDDDEYDDDYNDDDDNFADDDYDHDDYIIRANWLWLFFKLSTSGVDDYDDDIDGYNIQSPRTVHHCSSDNQVLQSRPRQRQVFLQVPKLTTSNTIIFLILTNIVTLIVHRVELGGQLVNFLTYVNEGRY